MEMRMLPTHWLGELNEILNECEERCQVLLTKSDDLGVAVESDLAFDSLMSLFEVIPLENVTDALGIAMPRLSNLPASFRRQRLTSTLLNSPSMPLVRSLSIGVMNKGIERYFSDPRIAAVEELIFLGIDYETTVPTH